MSAARTPLPERALAIGIGVLVALSPTIGPFVALTALLGGRPGWRGADGLWWLAAALLALPWLATAHLLDGALSALQVLAAWLLYRAAQDARRHFASHERLRDLGSGLLLGLVGLTIGGIAGIDAFGPDALVLFIRTFAWREHPTLFAHTAVVVSALVALTATHGIRRTLALAIGAISVLLGGAIEAVLAWMLVMVAVTAVQQSRRARAANLLLLGVVVVLVAGASSYLGLGRSGFLIDLADRATEINLLQGTETASGDWWHALDVTLTTDSAPIDGQLRTTFTLQKSSDRPWARLQQMARLDAGVYTLSVYLRPEGGTRPGLDIWGRLRGGAGTGD